MKKIILLFLLISAELSAQNYLTDDAIWTINTQECFFCPVAKIQYYFSGDTILNSKTYRKVFQRTSNELQASSYFGAIREEAGKIYANLGIEFGYFGEFLLYDFTLKAGDTTKISMPNFGSELSGTYTVTRVDTVQLLNGEKRKKFEFNEYSAWIEGIGSLSGLFTQAYPMTTTELTPVLLCFKQSGVELYKDPYYCSDGTCCDLIAGLKEIQAEQKRSTLFPNETKDYTVLQFTNQNVRCSSVEMVDVIGRHIKTIPLTDNLEYKLDLSNYSTGIYFVLVQYNDKKEVHKVKKM